MNKKLGKILTTLVLMFPLLASLGTTQVEAAEGDSVTVNLHKRVFEEGKDAFPNPLIQNTGEEMPDFGGQPLNGVTFEVFDVSNEYLTLVGAENGTPESATAKIVEDAKNSVPAYATSIATQVTAGEGVATFADLPIKAQTGKYATYLFVEKNSPANIKEKAAPIVLTMPVYKGDTEEVNTNIHVYPKNEQEELITKDLDAETKADIAVTINGETVYNVEKGQNFGYQISALLPWNIGDKDFYHITDTPNAGMKVNTDTVDIEGLEKGKDFIVEPKGDGYVLKFDTKSEAVKALAGKRVVVKYTAFLTEDAAIDTGINNEASVTVGNNVTPSQPGTPGEPEEPTDPEPPVTGPEVFTGGKKFQKVDDKSGKTLAGAKFNLVKVDADGNVISYATLTDGKYTWGASQGAATSFDSDAEGKLQVTGLEYSEKLAEGTSYALVEYEAPTGYAKLDKPVLFDVVKGEFGTEILSVTNVKKGLLPSTGGNGIYMFLVAGAVLMAGALVWYRRTQVGSEV